MLVAAVASQARRALGRGLGKATVTRGEKTETLAENQSTFIPVGTKHRLQNLTDAPLFLIEVQSGSYLGEDDIERFDDRYGGPEGLCVRSLLVHLRHYFVELMLPRTER
jgi:hypothetical protein